MTTEQNQQMSPERYKFLMQNESERLTPEEAELGWHFCGSFDGLLVGPNMKEQAVCECPLPWEPGKEGQDDATATIRLSKTELAMLSTLLQIRVDALNPSIRLEAALMLGSRLLTALQSLMPKESHA